MTKQTRGLAPLALALTAGAGLTLSAWAAPSQDPVADPTKGAGQTVGETVDKAAKTISKGVRDTAESVREQFARARSSVHAMGIQARVYSRLHWDKALTDSDLTLDVSRDGVATLTGNVADLKAKTRAVDLARETVGVTSVVDRLTVVTASPGAAKPAVRPAAR